MPSLDPEDQKRLLIPSHDCPECQRLPAGTTVGNATGFSIRATARRARSQIMITMVIELTSWLEIAAPILAVVSVIGAILSIIHAIRLRRRNRERDHDQGH